MRRIDSNIAHVEPLPLVPPTVMTGHSSPALSLSSTSATRSRPSAIALGCCFSMYSSHSESERATVRMILGLRACVWRGPRRARGSGGQCSQGTSFRLYGYLVWVERDVVLDRGHLVEGRFVAPHRVIRPAFEGEVGRVALERAMRGVRGALEALHPHV